MDRIVTLTMNPAVDLFTSTARIVPTDKLRCGPPLVHPGGGGINVARVVARLGGGAAAVFPAGGATGAQLRRLLEAERLPIEPVAVSGDTRQDFSVRDDERAVEYRFVLPGPTLEAAEWQACLQRVVARAGEGCRFVVASGSLPSGVPQDFYARLARLLAARGLPLVLDASGPALAEGLEAGVHLVKPSLRELRELTGQALEDTGAQRAACEEIIRRGGAQLVALSLGADGALLVTAETAWTAAALRVPVASAIGAGDSFLGGMVSALADGEPAERAFVRAMAASAAALLAPGTALCTPADVERLVPQVQVRRL